MSNGLTILIYCIAAYGLSNIVVFGSGPFRVFERLRGWAYSISEHFHLLFSCMMCLPANIGLLCSLFNWFLVSVPFTPFNILFQETNLWWLAACLDSVFTSGIVWIVHNVETFFENLGENGEREPEPPETPVEADDITIQSQN